MNRRLDSEYFDWLVAQIEVHSHKSYLQLFEKLHEREFVWIIPNDDNRVGDGLDLRTEFIDGTHGWTWEDIKRLPLMRGKGATVLEVLIGLSRRVAFVCGGEAPWWAWQLIGNLGLYRFPDPIGGKKVERLNNILDSLIWRTYNRNGEGGFFPLTDPNEDQTKVEIWTQMNHYAMEIQE